MSLVGGSTPRVPIQSFPTSYWGLLNTQWLILEMLGTESVGEL
jgi:hypothetical protein